MTTKIFSLFFFALWFFLILLSLIPIYIIHEEWWTILLSIWICLIISAYILRNIKEKPVIIEETLLIPLHQSDENSTQALQAIHIFFKIITLLVIGIIGSFILMFLDIFIARIISNHSSAMYWFLYVWFFQILSIFLWSWFYIFKIQSERKAKNYLVIINIIGLFITIFCVI